MNSPKVALITGAARRIGAVIANTLHQQGMNVIIHYRHSATEAQALCAKLNELRPDSARILQADLHHINEFPTLCATAAKAFGRLDALVNNASCFYPTPLGTVTESAWQSLIDSNLKAPFFLIQAAIPWLAKTQGCVINIADIHGRRPLADHSAYCISKAGLLMLTLSLAKELGPDIRVNAIAPGATLWPEADNTLSEERKNQIISDTALKRAGLPLDIAKAVWFFIADAGYVTGQILNIDGGRALKL